MPTSHTCGSGHLYMDTSKWELVMEHLTCSHIGDESYYRRHIQKQAALKNEHAIDIVDAMEEHKNLLFTIQQKINTLNGFGHETLKAICDVIVALDTFQLHSTQMWTICAMTGSMCSQCISLDLKSGFTVTIDSKFEDFFKCLWIIFNIDKIQMSRIVQFEDKQSVDDKNTISDRIS